MAELDVGHGLRSRKRRGASILLATRVEKLGEESVISRLFHTENYISSFIGVCSELHSSEISAKCARLSIDGEAPLIAHNQKKPNPCEVGLRLALFINHE